MKKSIVLFAVIIASIATYSQSASLHFKMKDWDTNDDTKMEAVFRIEQLTGFSVNSEVKIRVPIDSIGNFNFTVQSSYWPVRLFCVVQKVIPQFGRESKNEKGPIFNSVRGYMYVESGDSICFTVSDNQRKESSFLTVYCRNDIVATGKGRKKYECQAMLDKVDLQPLDYGKNLSRIPSVADSLINVKLSILKKFKRKISPVLFNCLKADVVAITELKAFNRLKSNPPTEASLEDDSNRILNKADFEKQRKCEYALEEIWKNLKKSQASLLADQWVQCRYSKELLYRRALDKFIFDRSYGSYVNLMKSMVFEDLYAFIIRNYSNVERDLVLASAFAGINQMFMRYKDHSNYSKLLNDAIHLVETFELKQLLEQLARSRQEGTIAYDFALPADSSGKIIHLSQFKGKVVLLDFWGDYCTGCYMFSKAFHETVFPVFKSRNDFAVVSVMLSGKREKYEKILRHEVGPVYTYSDYINLFAGIGNSEGRKIEEWYHVDAIPLILLIGKDGKIFSSNVPFFTEKNAPNRERLITLINQALSQDTSTSKSSD